MKALFIFINIIIVNGCYLSLPQSDEIKKIKYTANLEYHKFSNKKTKIKKITYLNKKHIACKQNTKLDIIQDQKIQHNFKYIFIATTSSKVINIIINGIFKFNKLNLNQTGTIITFTIYKNIIFFSKDALREIVKKSTTNQFTVSLGIFVFIFLSSFLNFLFFIIGFYQNYLYFISIILEILAEAFLSLILFNDISKFFILDIIESVGSIIKTLWLIPYYFKQNINFVQMFGLSEFLYSNIILFSSLAYYIYTFKRSNIKKKLVFQYKLFIYFSDVLSYFYKSLLDFISNGTEKLMFLYFFSKKEKGIYAIVSSLGSLVINNVFGSLEKSYYVAFQKNYNKKQYKNLLKTFYIGFKTVFFIGLVFLIFGPRYSTIFFNIISPKSPNKDILAEILSYYCLYIISSGLNGMISRLKTSIVKKYDYTNLSLEKIMIVSIKSLLGSFLINCFGLKGFIIAISIDMLINTLMTYLIINLFYKPINLSIKQLSLDYHILMNGIIISILLYIFSLITYFSNHIITKVIYILIGIFCFFFFMKICWQYESKIFNNFIK